MYWLNFDKRSMHVWKYKSVIETGLSDCQWRLGKISIIRPRVINWRSYRDFSNETFRVSLINNLPNEVFVNNDDGLETFYKTTMDTLNSFTPIKKD